MTGTHLHEPEDVVLTADYLRLAPPRLGLDVLEKFLLERWGIEGELSHLSGERDQNIRVITTDGSAYVCKVASLLEDLVLVDFQTQALLHLESVDPTIAVPRVQRSLQGNLLEMLTTGRGEHPVRVLSWVEGTPFGELEPPSHHTIAQVGALQGRMCRAFRGFQHAGGEHFMPWDILNGLVESDTLRNDYLRGDLAAACDPILDHLASSALPRMRQLPQQVIHNDAHSGNVLCDPRDPATVTGVIDFGDLLCRPLVVDLATSLSSFLERSVAPVTESAALLGGFVQHMDIPPGQLELVYDAMMARAILIVQLLQFRAENTRAGASLVEEDIPMVRQGLELALTVDRDEFYDALQEAVSSRSRHEQ